MFSLFNFEIEINVCLYFLVYLMIIETNNKFQEIRKKNFSYAKNIAICLFLL